MTACSTFHSHQTDNLVKNPQGVATSSKLDVPFVRQRKFHCGPATLSMALAANGVNRSADELAKDLFSKKFRGTFQADMMSSARREGMLTLPVTNVESLLREVNDGRPVIVFQNRGLAIWPRWHYALVVGYDLSGPDLIMHTGGNANDETDMRAFERTWRLGEFWGLVLVKPGEISATGSETDHLQAAAMLEAAGKIPEAKISYQRIERRWPKSLGAMLGLGNVYFTEKNFKESEKTLHSATQYHKTSSLAWHNLATVQAQLGKKAAARKSAQIALEKADQVLRPKFQQSLKDLL